MIEFRPHVALMLLLMCTTKCAQQIVTLLHIMHRETSSLQTPIDYRYRILRNYLDDLPSKTQCMSPFKRE